MAEDLIFSVHEVLNEKKNAGNPEFATDIHPVAKLSLKSIDLCAQEKFNLSSTILYYYSY